jgi:hypothetical protein
MLYVFQIGVKKEASTLGDLVVLGECCGTQWIFSQSTQCDHLDEEFHLDDY